MAVFLRSKALETDVTARPLRIAMFSDSVLPILNGVSISVDALVTELRHQGHSVHMYANRFPGFRDQDPNTFRFRAVEFPFWQGYPLLIPPVYHMLRRFRQHEYDVIHTHTPFLLGMVGLRWAESHEIPIVSTYHTLYDRYAHYVRCLPRRYVRYRIAKHTNFYYNRMQHVITPTDASQKWLVRHAVETNVHVIPTGSPRPPVVDRSEVRASLGMKPDQKILLYVGRLAHEKNLDMLIAGAAKAMKEDAQLRLWLVGDGPYRDACVTIARRLGIGDRVKFVGFLPRSEVDPYYAAADLFVFASETETQGLVVQEAMLHALPAVVVTGGGAGEKIVSGENGFITRNDASDFSHHVNLVLRDDSLYARIADGARRTGRTYSIEEMTHHVLKVYRQAIASPVDHPREESLVKF
jgi:glycosyltransferase involved in cell wall biosynthesis